MSFDPFVDGAHRPWPVPGRLWLGFMRWHDLLFMHWAVPVAALRPLVPAGLEVETYDGRAWVGVVPFRMSGIRLRWLPPVPGTSAFPELNVRTYVTAGGKPGVWFFSLDAASRLAVRVARWSFHLPYFDAQMSCSLEESRDAESRDANSRTVGHADGRAKPQAAGEVAGSSGGPSAPGRWIDSSAPERWVDSSAPGRWVDYASVRTHRGAPSAAFRGRYRATGEAAHSAPGTLEHFLTERYCLYSADRRGRLFRGEIAHAPWSLHAAEAEVERNTMLDPLGLDVAGVPPLLHYAGDQDVVAWRLELLS